MGGGARPAAARGVSAGAAVPPDVVLRPARLEDVPAVVAIERACFSDPWSISSFVALVLRRVP